MFTPYTQPIGCVNRSAVRCAVWESASGVGEPAPRGGFGVPFGRAGSSWGNGRREGDDASPTARTAPHGGRNAGAADRRGAGDGMRRGGRTRRVGDDASPMGSRSSHGGPTLPHAPSTPRGGRRRRLRFPAGSADDSQVAATETANNRAEFAHAGGTHCRYSRTLPTTGSAGSHGQRRQSIGGVGRRLPRRDGVGGRCERFCSPRSASEAGRSLVSSGLPPQPGPEQRRPRPARPPVTVGQTKTAPDQQSRSGAGFG